MIDIYSLLENGENNITEFKISFQKEVIESVVAFANAKGGKIIIGIDDNATIIGITISKEDIQNYINTIKQNTQPSIIVDIDEYNLENKTILIIQVQEYPLKPIAYKNKYYKRVKNSNHIMSLDEISNEHLKTINSSWDYHIDDRHTFKDISQENIINFIKRIEKFQNKSFNDDPMSILRKYELLKEEKLTFGAYLLFTSNNSVLTAFQIGRFKSETKIIDNIDINTDLFSQIDIIIEFIKKHLMVEFIITGEPQRQEKYDYALEAIREIVINMVVHRDYKDSGNSIIKIFDDRIEFFNPGKLHDDLTIEKLNSNNYSSRTRNRAIARAFKEAGIIEQYGSGIKRIKNECKTHGLIEPKFEEFVHGFRVTVFKEKLKENEGINKENEGINKENEGINKENEGINKENEGINKENEGINKENEGINKENEGINKENEGIKILLEYIKTNPNKRISQIEQEINVPSKTIERWIKQLKKDKKVEFQGSNKTGGYFAR